MKTCAGRGGPHAPHARDLLKAIWACPPSLDCSWREKRTRRSNESAEPCIGRLRKGILSLGFDGDDPSALTAFYIEEDGGSSTVFVEKFGGIGGRRDGLTVDLSDDVAGLEAGALPRIRI